MQKIILLSCFFGVASFTANTQVIDSTFGIPTSLDPCCLVHGITGCNFGGSDQAFLAVHLDDGRIILAGDTRWQGEGDFAIARLMPDGQYDQSVGVDGQVRIDLGYPNDSCLAAARYQNDQILMGGCVWQAGTTGYVNLIARVDLNGNLDPSFGNSGFLTIDLPTVAHKMITKIRPLPDGKIVIAGNILYGSVNWPDSTGIFLGRLLPNGQVDTSFGTAGFVHHQWELGCNASILGDAITDNQDRILLTGASYDPYLGIQEGTINCQHDIVLFRYLSNGQPDPGFGSNGSLELPNTAKGRGYTLAIYEDGRILLAGAAGNLLLSSPAYVFLARFMPDGTPDITFGDNGRFKKGIIVYGLSGGIAEPFGVLRMRDRILVGVSNSIIGDDPGFGAICLTENGKIDSTFGIQGSFNAFPDLTMQSYINQISSSADNNFFFSGYSRLLQPNNMAIAKVRWDITSKMEEKISHFNIKIYPNPVSQGFFYLDIGNIHDVEENLSLKLKDVNGRIIYQQRCVEVTGAINVPDFLSGLYFVELVGQRSHYLGKIVFQK